MKKRILLIAGAAISALTLTAPAANAAPGQCFQSPFGGWCDSLPLTPDGVFQHCENALGWANCFLVRPVPPEVDPRGWVPV